MVITIARQYGSGGREVGERLAELLGYRFFDREVLTLGAENASIHPEIAKRFDEKPMGSLLYSAFIASSPEEALPLNQKLALSQFETIRSLSEEGSCIFVGRCADMVLQRRSDLVRLFLHAPMDWRKERVVSEYGVPEPMAEKVIKKTDKQRSEYYEFFTQLRWGACSNYDLTVNVAMRGIEGTAQLLAKLVQEG